MKPLLHPAILKITFVYLVFSVLWIFVTDQAAHLIANEYPHWDYRFLQKAKGLFFVMLSTLVVYFLARRFLKELRHNEGEYMKLFMENAAPMWIYDLETMKFVLVNKAALESYGYSKNEFLSLKIKDIRPERQWHKLQELMKNPREKEPVHFGTWTHIKKDGREILVNITSKTVTYKGKPARLVMAEDVTERLNREMENERLRIKLEERQKYLDSILNAETSYVIRLDQNGNLLYANPAFLKDTGHENHNGIRFVNLIPENQRKKLETVLNFCIQGSDEWLKTSFPLLVSGSKDVLLTDWNFTRINLSGNKFEIQATGIDNTQKMHSEQAVKKYAQELEEVLENMTDMFYTLDTNYCFTRTNKRFREALGIKNEQIIGKSIFEFYPKDSSWFQFYEKVMLDKKPITVEGLFEPTGRYLHTNIYPVPNGIAVYFRDRTSKYEAESRQEEFLGRLNDLINSITDVFFTLDRNLRITEANEPFRQKTNLDTDEYEGRKIYELFREFNKVETREKLDLVLKERQVKVFEVFWEANQAWHLVNCYPTSEGMFVFMRDINNYKNQQRDLIMANQKYHYIQEATNDIVWDYDLYDNRLDWNQSLTRLTGYELEDVPRTLEWWFDHIHPDDVDYVKTSFDNSIASGKKRWTSEYRFLCKNGQYRYFYDRAFFIMDENGNPLRVIGAMQDIHEQKLNQLRIRRQVENLREIAWIQSHNVRKPVANIMALIELILSEDIDNDIRQDALQLLKEPVNELDDLIKEIVQKTQGLEDPNS